MVSAGEQQSFESDSQNVSNSTPSTSPDKSKKRLKSTLIWHFFTKYSSNDGEATCNLCGKTLRQPIHSTSNLHKHLLARHKAEYDEAASKNEHFPRSNKTSKEKLGRNFAWRYFTKSSEREGDAICNFCAKTLRQPLGSSSNLIKHLHSVHKEEYKVAVLEYNAGKNFKLEPANDSRISVGAESSGLLDLQ